MLWFCYGLVVLGFRLRLGVFRSVADRIQVWKIGTPIDLDGVFPPSPICREKGICATVGFSYLKFSC